MRADLSYCDFLILCPLPFETQALVDAFEESGWTVSRRDSNQFPKVFDVSISDSEIAYFRRHAAIVQLNHQGVLNASVDTARVLELYEPGYVVSFGIAGTLNKIDAPLESVVFATSLIYYEPSKDSSKMTLSRMDPILVGSDLLNPFRHIVLEGVTSVDGPIASGEKLIADVNSSDRNRIFASNDKTVAVEMEAAGVGRAVNKLWPTAEFVVLKGISDAADKKKNRVSTEQQNQNRSRAANNAARCLVQLIREAPLRRVFRGIPRPFEVDMAQTAMREAKQISDILEPYGITANYTQLYACLYGRRGPIPAYFHWDQQTSELHWIDFKILTALSLLPRELVTPTPFVTLEADDVLHDGPWHRTVKLILDVEAVTERQIKAQLEQLSQFINRVGFTLRAEQEIRTELEKLDHTGRPEITLNLMRYMLGQFCHRRMFVFTWKSYRAKWEQLTQAFGTWFSIFEWDTIFLDGKLGKQEPPGMNLVIEPGSYTSLKNWLSTSPDPLVVQEFVDQFRCHREADITQIGAQTDSGDQLNDLTTYWDRIFFSGGRTTTGL